MEAWSGECWAAGPKIRAARPRRSTISSFPEGLETLPRRMAQSLKIQTGCSGIRIGKDVQAKATVLAVPAFRAAEILAEMYPELAAMLGAIDYAPIVVATTSMPVRSLSAPLRGFGFPRPPIRASGDAWDRSSIPCSSAAGRRRTDCCLRHSWEACRDRRSSTGPTNESGIPFAPS